MGGQEKPQNSPKATQMCNLKTGNIPHTMQQLYRNYRAQHQFPTVPTEKWQEHTHTFDSPHSFPHKYSASLQQLLVQDFLC